MELKPNLLIKNIIYDRACDLTDNTYIETVIGQSSIDGKQGIKATYWNNRDLQGQPVTVEQITHPIQLTTDGAHEFAAGVNLQGFSGKYETVYKASESGEIVFKVEPRGRFELVVNGDTLYKPVRFGSRSIRVPLQVEKGKEYRIEASFRQLGNFPASLSLDFGKEMPVKFAALIDKLKGVDVVIFAGGISSQLEGEQMPVNIAGF